MNQTEYLKKKNTTKPGTTKTPRIKLGKTKFFIIIGGSIAILVIIFLISFSVSYSKIATNKKISKNTSDLIQEKVEEIERLNRELKDKDKQIVDMQLQIEDYEIQVEELKEREQYAKMIAEEMEKLPKDKVQVVYVPSESKDESDEQSDVQADLYQKAGQ